MDQDKLFKINHAVAIENIKATALIIAVIMFIGFFVR